MSSKSNRKNDDDDDKEIKKIRTSQNHRKLFEYVIELGIRLGAKSETIANAAIYCYKVLKNGFPQHLCSYTMATSCFLLAGKITNDTTISVRDVLNISHRILHSSAPPLDIGELLYTLRESLLEMELVVLRFLRFKLNFEQPHRHFIVMLAILRNWFPTIFDENPNIDQVASMFLQDLYVQPQIVIDHRPKTLAVVIISMVFSELKLDVPDESWVPTVQPKLHLSRLQQLKDKVTKELYDR